MANGNEQSAEAKPAQPAKPTQAADRAALKEARTRGQRSLYIMVMLMFFVSIVVFVVGTYFFVVPRIITQDLEIRHLQLQLATLYEALTLEETAPPDAAPEAPATPEVKPTDPNKKGPIKSIPDK